MFVGSNLVLPALGIIAEIGGYLTPRSAVGALTIMPLNDRLGLGRVSVQAFIFSFFLNLMSQISSDARSRASLLDYSVSCPILLTVTKSYGRCI
jgi:hypothetical protein